MLVPNPLSLSFSQWAYALTLDNGLSIAPPFDEQNWAKWARDLRDTVNIGSALPDPAYFDGWQPWAIASITALERI